MPFPAKSRSHLGAQASAICRCSDPSSVCGLTPCSRRCGLAYSYSNRVLRLYFRDANVFNKNVDEVVLSLSPSLASLPPAITTTTADVASPSAEHIDAATQGRVCAPLPETMETSACRCVAAPRESLSTRRGFPSLSCIGSGLASPCRAMPARFACSCARRVDGGISSQAFGGRGSPLCCRSSVCPGARSRVARWAVGVRTNNCSAPLFPCSFLRMFSVCTLLLNPMNSRCDGVPSSRVCVMCINKLFCENCFDIYKSMLDPQFVLSLCDQ